MAACANGRTTQNREPLPTERSRESRPPPAPSNDTEIASPQPGAASGAPGGEEGFEHSLGIGRCYPAAIIGDCDLKVVGPGMYSDLDTIGTRLTGIVEQREEHRTADERWRQQRKDPLGLHASPGSAPQPKQIAPWPDDTGDAVNREAKRPMSRMIETGGARQKHRHRQRRLEQRERERARAVGKRHCQEQRTCGGNPAPRIAPDHRVSDSVAAVQTRANSPRLDPTPPPYQNSQSPTPTSTAATATLAMKLDVIRILQRETPR